jgi:hypothetical protein
MPDPTPAPTAPPAPRVVKPGHLLLAIVDGPDDDNLKCVKIYEWDRSFSIPNRDDPKFAAWIRKLGLARPYRVQPTDITDRPDIQVGEPFPFRAKKEA